MRADVADYFRYIGEEFRNEGRDWSDIDTAELREIPVPKNLKRYNTHKRAVHA